MLAETTVGTVLEPRDSHSVSAYRALLLECRGLLLAYLLECMALVLECKALLIENRALSTYI